MDDTAKHISRSQAKAGFRPVLVLLVLLLPFSSQHMFNSDKRVPHTAVLCTKCSPCALQNMIMCLRVYVRMYIHTLHTLGEVPQVEDVVGLGWCGKEVFAHPSIDLHRCINNGLRKSLHFISELSKEAPGDSLWISTHRHIYDGKVVHTNGVVGVSGYQAVFSLNYTEFTGSV